MKKMFYPKLALVGIKQNKRLYIPYIMSGIVMVMMFYIITYLGQSSVFEKMKGGEQLATMLLLGTGVIGIFSVIFMFYTNSFIVKQRYKEFGLYNILGMDKGNISHIMFWENVIVAIITVSVGLVIGIAFSKFAEVCMVNLLRQEVNYELSISGGALITTLEMFCVVYLILLINSLIKVHFAKPLELLQSSKAGEKPIKVNWVFAVLGVLILAAAYYIAVTVKSPLQALTIFFIAVIMVIVATYILFITGSVAFCRILQKNKRYYYKLNHFVSVSSMTYRMKRNGAGLASICILCTMVLVMISASACLFIGEENLLYNRYPNDINTTVQFEDLSGMDDKNRDLLENTVNTVLEKHNLSDKKTKVTYQRKATNMGIIDNGSMYCDERIYSRDYTGLCMTYYIPLEDYNNMMGQNVKLNDGEVIIYPVGTEYTGEALYLGDEVYKVASVVDEFSGAGDAQINIVVPSIFIFTTDMDGIVEALSEINDVTDNGIDENSIFYYWEYAFNVQTDEDTKALINKDIKSELFKLKEAGSYNILGYSSESRAEGREYFYLMFGALFFLGIILSLVFVFAMVMIIYYKQISEGYEDRARFEIMQKVGMTKRDIRRSINSQVLTIFFMPLGFAGLHLAFAFPALQKLLRLFNLTDMQLLMIVTVVCFVVFGLLYGLVYKLTAGAYYKIVSTGGREA